MALQKKKYRSANNRSRGGGMTTQVRGDYSKDYSRNVRSFHGGNSDEVQDRLAKQIARIKKYG